MVNTIYTPVHIHKRTQILHSHSLSISIYAQTSYTQNLSSTPEHKRLSPARHVELVEVGEENGAHGVLLPLLVPHAAKGERDGLVRHLGGGKVEGGSLVVWKGGEIMGWAGVGGGKTNMDLGRGEKKTHTDIDKQNRPPRRIPHPLPFCKYTKSRRRRTMDAPERRDGGDPLRATRSQKGCPPLGTFLSCSAQVSSCTRPSALLLLELLEGLPEEEEEEGVGLTCVVCVWSVDMWVSVHSMGWIDGLDGCVITINRTPTPHTHTYTHMRTCLGVATVDEDGVLREGDRHLAAAAGRGALEGVGVGVGLRGGGGGGGGNALRSYPGDACLHPNTFKHPHEFQRKTHRRGGGDVDLAPLLVLEVEEEEVPEPLRLPERLFL